MANSDTNERLLTALGAVTRELGAVRSDLNAVIDPATGELTKVRKELFDAHRRNFRFRVVAGLAVIAAVVSVVVAVGSRLESGCVRSWAQNSTTLRKLSTARFDALDRILLDLGDKTKATLDYERYLTADAAYQKASKAPSAQIDSYNCGFLGG